MKVSQLSFLSLVAAMWLAAGPVFAQLTLGASASASTDEGVSGSADADAQSDDATAPEPDPVPIAAPAPNPEPVADTTLDEPNVETLGGEGVAGWDKGFYIQTPDKNFKLKINSVLKTRFAYYNDEVQVIGDDGSPGTNHINHAAFGLPYWRLALSGNVFSPRLTYTVMYDFAVGTLPEATVDWAFIPEKLHLSVGVFKRPFDRDYINSTAANNLIFNSIGAMGGGADVGIMISNDYTRVKGIEWAFGVFDFYEGDWSRPAGSTPSAAAPDARAAPTRDRTVSVSRSGRAQATTTTTSPATTSAWTPSIKCTASPSARRSSSRPSPKRPSLTARSSTASAPT